MCHWLTNLSKKESAPESDQWNCEQKVAESLKMSRNQSKGKFAASKFELDKLAFGECRASAALWITLLSLMLNGISCQGEFLLQNSMNCLKNIELVVPLGEFILRFDLILLVLEILHGFLKILW